MPFFGNFFFNFEINRNYLNVFYVQILGHLGIFFHKFGLFCILWELFDLLANQRQKKNRKKCASFWAIKLQTMKILKI